MDMQELLVATNIALLRRQFPPWKIEEQIFEAFKMIRQLISKETIAREAGEEPTYEDAIACLDIIISSGSYQDLASWTITKGKTGILSKVEMACEAYSQGRFRLVISDKEMWADKELPDSLTLSFPDITIRGGTTVKIQGKSADASAFKMWGDITGKEVV